MEAPRCKHCGKRHWDRVCPDLVFPSEAGERKHKLSGSVTVKQLEEAFPSPPAPFDRKAYQREYMKTYLPRWRAKRKLPPP